MAAADAVIAFAEPLALPLALPLAANDRLNRPQKHTQLDHPVLPPSAPSRPPRHAPRCLARASRYTTGYPLHMRTRNFPSLPEQVDDRWSLSLLRRASLFVSTLVCPSWHSRTTSGCKPTVVGLFLNVYFFISPPLVDDTSFALSRKVENRVFQHKVPFS